MPTVTSPGPAQTEDEAEFQQFCERATTNQLMNIYEKELFAERFTYASIAMQELLRPGRALK